MEMTTQEAVRHLSKALREDPGYWESWKANIAVQFQDEFRKNCIGMGVHEISNRAAENFLQLLTAERTDPRP